MIECWYAEKPIKEKGIIQYMEAAFPQTGKKQTEFRTLLSDLTESEEEILSHFSKNCMYKVKRAPREGVTARMYFGEELKDGRLIQEFVDFFREFWESKGVAFSEKQKCQEELMRLAQADALSIGTASVGEKCVVYHVYIVDELHARLLHSASQFRVDEEIPQTVVGFANRYLHKESMLFFKKLGKKIYDWGGAGLDEEVASITTFKESFGGTVAYFYNGQSVNGILPKLYSLLAEVYSKI